MFVMQAEITSKKVFPNPRFVARLLKFGYENNCVYLRE